VYTSIFRNADTRKQHRYLVDLTYCAYLRTRMRQLTPMLRVSIAAPYTVDRASPLLRLGINSLHDASSMKDHAWVACNAALRGLATPWRNPGLRRARTASVAKRQIAYPEVRVMWPIG